MTSNPLKFFDEGELVAVLTTQPIDRFLDYKAPAGGVGLGAMVEVPLGPRRVLGVVWGPGEGAFDPAKIRKILRVIDLPAMRPEMMTFLTRAADYTVSPMSSMLRQATRMPGLGEGPATRRVLRMGEGWPDRMTPARERVIAVLEESPDAVFQPSELAALAGVSSSVVGGLVRQGVVIEEEAARDAPFEPLDPERSGKTLSENQKTAAVQMCTAIRTHLYGTSLLKGVTGSGKTEVYLEAVAETLRAGRQALVLLPEIALTVEFIDRVEARFGAKPAEWHSGITQADRRRAWAGIAKGEAKLVVGARSALFLPFEDLGLIVVDEEHDGSYKQEDMLLYNARDMAVLRASITKAQVILASATPSLETWTNAEAGKYRRIDLTERFGAAVMPELMTVDMRAEKLPKARWLSESIAKEVDARIERGEQSLLFLNRRGYAPVTQCRACGEQIACEECDTRMVEHRFRAELMCHMCGATRPMPDACPSCEAVDKLAPIGPGVERLAEEVEARFPTARIAILSSDLATSVRDLKRTIDEIASGAADILIGTQIVAKGHNFPLLTLVGVLDADLGLSGADLRAAEKCFQLVRQVAGRAGRKETQGLAMVQTHQPQHPVMQAIVSGNDEDFWRAEARERQASGSPPFGRMAGVILSSVDERLLWDFARDLARRTRPLGEIGAEVYGPAAAPVARVRGRHRVRMLIKTAKGAPIQNAIRKWIGAVQIPNQVRLTIDIDPQSFY